MASVQLEVVGAWATTRTAVKLKGAASSTREETWSITVFAWALMSLGLTPSVLGRSASADCAVACLQVRSKAYVEQSGGSLGTPGSTV